MAHCQAKSISKKSQRQSSEPQVQGKQSQGIKRQQASRKSLRLQAIRQSHKQSLFTSNYIQEVQAPLSPPASNIPEGRKRPQTLYKPSTSSRKRKRGQEEQAGHPSFFRTQEQRPSKRLRTSPACDISEVSIDPLQHWVQTGKWRKEYFEQDSQVREYFERGKSPKELGQRDWLWEHDTRERFRAMHPFTHLHHLFARNKSSSSLGRKKSQSSLQTPSDQLPREVKSAHYRNPDYAIELEDEGSYMREFGDDDDDDIPKNVRDLCRTLLETEQMVPPDSLFRDDLFKKTCRKIQDRNETIGIAPGMDHPFFVIENKGCEMPIDVARNQAIRNGAAIINARVHLNAMAQDEEWERPKGADMEAIAFSCTWDVNIAELWIHWQETLEGGAVLYHMNRLGQYVTGMQTELVQFRHDIHTILDWGVLTNRRKCEDVVQKIMKKAKLKNMKQSGTGGSRGSVTLTAGSTAGSQA